MSETVLNTNAQNTAQVSIRLKAHAEYFLLKVMELIEQRTLDYPEALGQTAFYRGSTDLRSCPFVNNRYDFRQEYLFELKDVSSILLDFYFTDERKKKYVKDILIENKDSNDFDGKEFQKAVESIFSRIKPYLGDLKNDPSEYWVRVEEQEYIEATDNIFWINHLRKLNREFKIAAQTLFAYDKDIAGRLEVIMKTLDYFWFEQDDLYKKCYTGVAATPAVCVFNGIPYSITGIKENDDENATRLINSMALLWAAGEYKVIYENTDLTAFLYKYLENDPMFKEAAEQYTAQVTEIINNANDEAKRDAGFMDFLYSQGVPMQGFYWKRFYTEREFAKKVIAPLLDDENADTKADKAAVLCKLVMQSNRRKPGIEIIPMAANSIVSNYYYGREDNEGAAYAENFEKHIGILADNAPANPFDRDNRENDPGFVKIMNEYDNIILSILELNSYMRKSYGYTIITEADRKAKSKGVTVHTKKEYMDKLLETYKNAGETDEAFMELCDKIHAAGNDVKFDWWMKKLASGIVDEEDSEEEVEEVTEESSEEAGTETAVATEENEVVTAPVVEEAAPVVEQVVEQTVEPVVEPVVEQVVEPVVTPVAEQYAAPVAEQYAAPVAEQYAAPVAEQYVAPVTEQAVTPVTEAAPTAYDATATDVNEAQFSAQINNAE